MKHGIHKIWQSIAVVALMAMASLPVLAMEKSDEEPVDPKNAFKDVFNPRPLMKKLSDNTENAKNGKMRFLVFGDSKGSPHLKRVLAEADKLKPDFCITTADLVNRGGGEQGLIDYAKLNRDGGWFFEKYPTWPTVGNHEASGGKDAIENFAKFFGMTKPFYSFSYGNAKFIALPWKKATKSKELFAWLKNELEQSKEEHIFVFRHRPYYTVGSKGTDDVPNISTAVTELFTKHKVVTVFSGHDHIYYRTKRDQVSYIISAGAGAEIYMLERQAEALPDDVYYGVEMGRKGYVYKDKSGKKQLPYMHYLMEITIDGAKVDSRIITWEGEEMDAVNLKAKSRKQ